MFEFFLSYERLKEMFASPPLRYTRLCVVNTLLAVFEISISDGLATKNICRHLDHSYDYV